jgi:hypothetical protein
LICLDPPSELVDPTLIHRNPPRSTTESRDPHNWREREVTRREDGRRSGGRKEREVSRREREVSKGEGGRRGNAGARYRRKGRSRGGKGRGAA